LSPSRQADERSLLACALAASQDEAEDIVSGVNGYTFEDRECGEVFRIIRHLVSQGQAPDLGAIAKTWETEHHGKPLSEIVMGLPEVPSALNWEYHYQGLRDASERQTLAEKASKLAVDALDSTQDLTALRERWAGLAEPSEQPAGDSTIATGKALAAELLGDIQSRFDRQGQPTGIVTSYREFDRLTDGLQLGELAVIGARPSAGKTALLLNIADQACLRDKVPTLIVSAEMSRKALLRRLCACHAGIPLSALKRGLLTKRELEDYGRFQSTLAGAPLHVAEMVGGPSILAVSATVRRCVRRHKIRLVCVDYLQKLRAAEKAEKRTYEVGSVSGTLKSLAVDLNLAMLVAAQLSREPDKEKGRLPRLSDLADSAQIERDADLVGLLHRDRADGSNKAMLFIAKQRDGELGNVHLTFNGAHCRFEASSE